MQNKMNAPRFNVVEDALLIENLFQQAVNQAQIRAKAVGVSFYQKDAKTGELVDVNAESKPQNGTQHPR